MLAVHDAWEKLQKDSAYMEWQKSHSKSYLYVFFTIMQDKEAAWEVGFFNPKENTAASFLVGDAIEQTQENSRIFKPEDQKVQELNLKKVKISLDGALNIFETVRLEKYAKETPSKKIVILQNLKKPAWNITYLTAALNVLNIKIDAGTGIILEESLTSALSFNQAKQKAG